MNSNINKENKSILDRIQEELNKSKLLLSNIEKTVDSIIENLKKGK